MEPLPFSPDLLDRYRAGTATPDERILVDTWYASLHGNPDYLSTLAPADRHRLQEETFQAIRSKLGLPARSVIVPFRPVANPWFRQPWASLTGVAAALLLLLGSIVWLNRPVDTTALAHTEVASGKQPALADIRFVNRQPRIVAHRLPDGTVVWLHPEAELRYPARFRSDRRSVTFGGEAFFDVAKDARRPFLIQSGPLQIRVLGTSFNVRATPRQAIFEVAVVTGRVLVRSTRAGQRGASSPIVLLPRQEVLYTLATDQLNRYSLPAETRRPIYEPVSIAFSDAPMLQVINQLESRFNVRIRLANPAAASCQLTADFANQSLPEILELLCTSLDATYTMAGDTVIISSDGCQ